MKNRKEVIKFLEEQLSKIHYILCYINSNHGINMEFISNANKLDLSKKHPDVLYFYNKEVNSLLIYSKRSNKFWLSYYKIWSKLEEFGLSEQEIADLTKHILERNFKCNTNVNIRY